jgi:hypothetical protein
MASEKYTLVVVDIKQSSSLTTGHSKPGDTVILWEDFTPTSVEPLACEIARNMTRVLPLSRLLPHLADEL